MPQQHAPASALEQLRGFGLEVDDLDLSGTLRRVKHRDDRAGTKNGWYVAHAWVSDSGRDLVAGCYGWWKEGDRSHLLKFDAAGLSIDEQRASEQRHRELKAKAEAARADKAQEAARRAQEIWPKLPPEGASPYLARKQVAALGVRFARGAVVVPVRTGPSDAELVGLQWIDADGSKRFLTGTAKRGAWHALGEPPVAGSVCAIAEGYATAATVAMAMGWYVACAFDAGNLQEVARAHAQRYPGVQLVLLADDDHATRGNPGVTRATAAARSVRGVVAVPRFSSTAPDRGTDWNDLAVTEGLDVVRAQLGALDLGRVVETQPPEAARVYTGDFPGQEWRDRLQRTDKQALKSTAFNLRLILEHDPAWKGVIGWCEFSARIMKKRDPPYANASRGEWTDGDDAELRFWVAGRYGIEPKGQDLADAIMGNARGALFHPVREYLDGLRWDGVKRLDTWIETYLGAGEPGTLQPSPGLRRLRGYLRRVSAMTLIQAVARIRMPGCKADYVLILEGEQGRLKSTSLRVLFGDAFFSDTPIDLGSKDAYEAIRGLWCCEMAELDSLNKADATRAKAFFSSSTDRFRMPYGHRASRFPRQCVICGTTNQQQYLKDQTGNRRYWPVQCGEIDIESLREMRDQLWAEADHRHRQGEPWWPQEADRPLFEDEQEERANADVWESLIAVYLHELITPPTPRHPAWRQDDVFVTMAELMEKALKMDPGAMRTPEQTRVGIIMQRLGWRLKRKTEKGVALRGYQPGAQALAAYAVPPPPVYPGETE